MANFAGQGYFTLSDLDALARRIETLESILNGDNGLGDLFFYRQSALSSSGTDTKSTSLSIANAGIDIARVSTKLAHNAVIKHKFGQDFVEAPAVLASTETTSDNFTVHVENVSRTGCELRIISIQASKALSKSKKDKTEFVNIVALGKTIA